MNATAPTLAGRAGGAMTPTSDDANLSPTPPHTSDAPTDRCPICRQLGYAGPTARQLGPNRWQCSTCGLAAVDLADARRHYSGKLDAATVLARIMLADWHGWPIGADLMARAVGRYHRERGSSAADLLAELAALTRQTRAMRGGTDGDHARWTLVALAAAGYAIVDATEADA